jgi:hypothetical protein
MSPPPPPPPPPLPLKFPFQRQKQLTQHPNDSASTATLASLTSAATKLHFTEDTDSYFVPVKDKPTHHRRGSEPTPQSSLTRSNSSPPKTLSPPIRLWQWGRRWDESLTTLIGDNDHWKLNDTTSDDKIDTTPRLRALRAKMAEEHIDYL